MTLAARVDWQGREFPLREKSEGRSLWRAMLVYSAIVAGSVLASLLLAEVWLARNGSSRLTLPFYNRLYPYVMFRPYENNTYITGETFAMSHFKKRGFHYTNEDGFRVSAADYRIEKEKPKGQLRIAMLGSSAVQLGSTFEDTLPGSLKRLLLERYAGSDVEVINAGIQSCVSRQSIAQLIFTVADYYPDIVVLYDGVNDIGLPLTYESRANYPYNFHVMEAAWQLYRRERQAPLWDLLCERSRVWQAVRARLGKGGEEVTDPVTSAVIGPTPLTAERIIEDREYVKSHIAAYLSNWEKMIDLSKAYGYKPVCVLQPTAGLDRDYALKLTMSEFNLSEESANKWMEAFGLLYAEADRQIEEYQEQYPDAVFLNLRDYLKPPEKHFWDLVHVYDETNMLLAERIHEAIRGWINPAPVH